MPATIPFAEPTETLVLAVLHEPPADALLRVTDALSQTIEEPAIAAGNGFTVAITVVRQPVPIV
jgi:hypothetical protein